MSKIALSKLQFVAVSLICKSSLFTEEDLAHLDFCEVKLTNTTEGENALIADLDVYFDNWSYLDHRKSSHPAEEMPAETRVVFMQDSNRKLTGDVEVGFFAEDPASREHIEYLRGW